MGCPIKHIKVFLKEEGYPGIREATALDSETTQVSFGAYTPSAYRIFTLREF